MKQRIAILALVVTIVLSGCSSVKPSSATLTQALSDNPTPTTNYLLTAEPTATRILTELEAIDVEMRTAFGNVDPRCSTCEPLPGGTNCAQYLWTKPITKTEWGDLFPNAHFYLIEFRHIVNGKTNANGYEDDYDIIVQQDSQRYKLDTFDQLLKTNNLVVTDENRETIARSFTLIALANYLEGGIVFNNLEEGDWPAPLDFRYNYRLTGQTKIEGIGFQWFFWFGEGRLLSASDRSGYNDHWWLVQ